MDIFIKDGEELRKVYGKAKEGRYAFVASNLAEPNVMIGLIKGSDRKNSDLVLQLSRSACEFAGDGDPVRGLEVMGEYIQKVAEKYEIGVFLNMDHLRDLDFIENAVETGIPASVMIDASQKNFEENVEISGRVKEKCKGEGVLVEAELGKIKGAEDKVKSTEAYYTKPEEAVEFVRKTGCDLLATSIGTRHGIGKGKELDIRLDLAKKIDEKLNENKEEVPVVVHGSSGLTHDQLKKLAQAGVCKFNKDTRYQYEYTRTAFEFYREHKDEILPPEKVGKETDEFFTRGGWTPEKDYFDPRIASKKIRERIAEVMAELTDVVGSSEKSLYKN